MDPNKLVIAIIILSIRSFASSQMDHIYSSCVLRTYDFLSIYAIYFRDVNLVVLKIFHTNDTAQDLNYFADEISKIMFIKTRKKAVLWTSHNISTKFTIKPSPPSMKAKKTFKFHLERGTFRNVTSKVKTNSRDKAHAYIILVWNENNLNQILNENPRSLITRIRGLYFILFIEDITKASGGSKPLSRFWLEFGIFNVIATTLCDTGNAKNIFVYDPFHYHSSKWGKVKTLTVEEVLENPNSIFDFMDDFKGYPVKISLFDRPPTAVKIPVPLQDNTIYKVLDSKSGGYGGMDGCIVAFLALSLNFTSVISEPTSDNKYGLVSGNTITGSLGQVVNKTIDLSANGRFMVPYGTDEYEITAPLTNYDLCAVVPKSERIPQWRMIFHGFTTDTWIFIFGVATLCSCFWYLVQPCDLSHKSTGFKPKLAAKTTKFSSKLNCTKFSLEANIFLKPKFSFETNATTKTFPGTEFSSNGEISKTEPSKTEFSKTKFSKTAFSKTELSKLKFPKTEFTLTFPCKSKSLSNPKLPKPKLSPTKPSFAKATMDIIAVILNAPIKLPSRLGQRIFIASLMALNVIIMGIFQGTLVQSFSTISYYPDVNTLEQLDKSGLPIATSLKVFQNDASDLMRRLARKVITINSSALDRAAYERTSAAMERKEDAIFLIRTKYIKDGKPLLHVVNECPSSLFITYIVPRDSPFLPKFNKVIKIFFEAGMLEKWYNDFIEAIILEKRFFDVTSDKRKPFSLSDIQTAFYILFFGLLFSWIIFIAEVVLNYFLYVRK